jgi:hypothetical protein
MISGRLILLGWRDIEVRHVARVGRYEKYIQNVGGETSWNTFTTHISRY